MSTEAAAVEWLCPPDAYQHEANAPAHRHDERCRPGRDMTQSLVARIAVLESSAAAELMAALGRPSILASTALGEVLRQIRTELGLEKGDSVVDAVRALKARVEELEVK